MFLPNLILLGFLSVGTLWMIYGSYRNYKREQFNKHVAEELDVIIKSTLDSIARSGAKVNPLSPDDLVAGRGDLTTPQMLSTLVTVLVYKYGATRLGLKDFTDVPLDEYVSVYVDTTTNELILSLNHTLTDAGGMGMVNLSDTDDNTFH